MMPEYIEMDFNDFCQESTKWIDNSGYIITTTILDKAYRFNGERHNAFGPAYIRYNSDDVHYCLYGKKIGSQNDFTNETWIKFAARLIKLKAFE